MTTTITKTKIIVEIMEWTDDFDKLVEYFTHTNAYGIMLDETDFDYVGYAYFAQLYAEDEWREFLHYYVQEMLMDNINKGIKGEVTDNLFRLWREY
jgi:hypothetical protein